MSTRSNIQPVFEEALELLDSKETMYGNAWEGRSCEQAMQDLANKFNYIDARYEVGKDVKEDILDLINRAAFAYWHLKEQS